MKKFVLSILLLTSPILHAAQINCYSGHKVIYSGHGYNINYTDNLLSFNDSKTNKNIFIMADCIIIENI